MNTFEKYSDIYNYTKNKTTKEIGDCFEILTKYIFLVNKAYDTKTKNIWLYNDIPQHIKTNFNNLPDNDKGIDLLLQTLDDEYYPIQCKFRSNKYDKVTWNDLSSFVGQMHIGKFKKAYYVTNTYTIDDEIKRCDDIQIICGNDFNKEFFENVRNHMNNKNLVYAKKTLFDYQSRCVNDTIKYYETNDRGYLSMACGTGKTITTFNIDKLMSNTKTLVLVPSLYLLSQVYKEWILENNETPKN